VFKQYYQLTKPGIIYGNLLTAVAGFLLASQGRIDFRLLLATAAGTSLIIASACVFNNYIDRDIDAMMTRTKNRALASAQIEEEYAFAYGAVLGLLGAAILASWTNRTTLLLGVIGFVSYVFIYTYAKRRSVHATLLGSIPGATPIAAGYTAVTGRFDLGALLLFAIMVVWQLPHFYAIAMFRRDDYAAAGIPVLPVVRGMRTSKYHILLYTALFGVAAALLALYGYASFSFFVIMSLVSLYWLWRGTTGFGKGVGDVRWARQMFGTSLLVLLALSVMLAIDVWLP
jgi:protoheme IX farnesyltransferase